MANGLWVLGLRTPFWNARDWDKNKVPDFTHSLWALGLILIFLDLCAMEFGCSTRTHLSEHISKMT